MTRAQTWLAATPLPALGEALAAVQPGDVDGVAALVRPMLEETGWLTRLIDEFAGEAMRDPHYRPPIPAFDSDVQQGLLLYSDARIALFVGSAPRERLAAKRMRPRMGSIIIPGTYGLTRVLRGGDALLTFWEGGWRDGAIRPVVEAAGSRRLVDGETIVIDGRTTGFIVEHVRGDTILLQATIYDGAAPTLCEYDSLSLALQGTGAALDGASRVQLLANLLAEMGHDDPREALAVASTRPEPFARWSVMRHWAAHWPDSARPRLEAMAADDPDAELRGLARATIELIDAQEVTTCHG